MEKKLEDLSIADLKALSEYALKEWNKAMDSENEEGNEYWWDVCLDSKIELHKRVKLLFP